MKKFNFLAIFLVLQCWVISSVYAFDCENEQNIEDVLKQVDLKFNSGNLISCKVNPQNKNQLLIAYAVQKFIDDESEVEGYQLYIIGMNNKNRQVDYFYPVEKILVSDAIELSNLQWDLAAYNINRSTRAVGLRLGYFGRSRANPYSSEVLNLYDLDHKKQILDGLIVKLYAGETDTRCNADIKERKSVLVMQPTTTYEYFDIQVRSQLEYYEMSGNEDHCIEINRKTSKQNFLIKFNGLRYVIPTSYKKDYQY